MWGVCGVGVCGWVESACMFLVLILLQRKTFLLNKTNCYANVYQVHVIIEDVPYN